VFGGTVARLSGDSPHPRHGGDVHDPSHLVSRIICPGDSRVGFGMRGGG
jgi:hypothetical protein